MSGRPMLAIDPGNVQSGYVLLDEDYLPRTFGKVDNEELLGNLDRLLWTDGVQADVVIEQIGHYGTGMPAGTTVFDTCVWIGRFLQELQHLSSGGAPVGMGVDVLLVKRATVKAHICGSAKATDGNVAQALADRFAPGAPNRGKGTKDAPGWFYGFARDVWQAYACGVYARDQLAVLA